MHFTVLYFKENVKLEDTDLEQIEEEFANNYCYCCGETIPEIQSVCDWFQIGGRWCDILEVVDGAAGVTGDPSWCNIDYEAETNKVSICEVKDLAPSFSNVVEKQIYAVATETEYFEKGELKYTELLTKILNKEVNGVVTLIDCHD